MIRICRDSREVMKYKRLEYLKNGEDFVPILIVDNNIFAKARKIFSAGHMLIEVRDVSENTIFFLKMYRDMVNTRGGENRN